MKHNSHRFSKAGAKVLLFFYISKYFCKKMQKKITFLVFHGIVGRTYA